MPARTRHLIAAVTAAGVIATACGNAATPEATTTSTIPATTTTVAPTTTTTIPPTTTTTLSPQQIEELELEAAAIEIRKIWRQLSDSFATGPDAAYQVLAEHNHPQQNCTADRYASYYQWPDTYTLEIVMHIDTIETDPDWKFISGDAVGETPRGDIYIYQATVTDATGVGELIEAHGAILPDGNPAVFFACSE